MLGSLFRGGLYSFSIGHFQIHFFRNSHTLINCVKPT